MEGADTVFVSLGSAAENIEAAIDYIGERHGAKVGSVHINVLRPFPAAAVARALRGRKNVIVLERTDEALATDNPLTADQAAIMVRAIMNDKQIKEFDATKECNFAIMPQGIGRFRVSAFIQQGMVGAVLRTITTEIPTLEDLELPPILKDVVMNKRGLTRLARYPAA